MWSGVHMVKSLSTLYSFYTEVALYSYTLNTGEDIDTRRRGLKQKKRDFLLPDLQSEQSAGSQ